MAYLEHQMYMHFCVVKGCPYSYEEERQLENHLLNVHQMGKCMYCLKYQPLIEFVNHTEEHLERGERILQGNIHFPSEYTPNTDVASHEAARNCTQLYSQLLEREQPSPIIPQSQQRNFIFPSEHRNGASHEATFNSTVRNIRQLRSRFLKTQQRNVVSCEAALDSTAHNDRRLRSIDFKGRIEKPGTIKELHDYLLRINILEREDVCRFSDI